MDERIAFVHCAAAYLETNGKRAQLSRLGMYMRSMFPQRTHLKARLELYPRVFRIHPPPRGSAVIEVELIDVDWRSVLPPLSSLAEQDISNAQSDNPKKSLAEAQPPPLKPITPVSKVPAYQQYLLLQSGKELGEESLAVSAERESENRNGARRRDSREIDISDKRERRKSSGSRERDRHSMVWIERERRDDDDCSEYAREYHKKLRTSSRASNSNRGDDKSEDRRSEGYGSGERRSRGRDEGNSDGYGVFTHPSRRGAIILEGEGRKRQHSDEEVDEYYRQKTRRRLSWDRCDDRRRYLERGSEGRGNRSRVDESERERERDGERERERDGERERARGGNRERGRDGERDSERILDRNGRRKYSYEYGSEFLGRERERENTRYGSTGKGRELDWERRELLDRQGDPPKKLCNSYEAKRKIDERLSEGHRDMRRRNDVEGYLSKSGNSKTTIYLSASDEDVEMDIVRGSDVEGSTGQTNQGWKVESNREGRENAEEEEDDWENVLCAMGFKDYRGRRQSTRDSELQRLEWLEGEMEKEKEDEMRWRNMTWSDGKEYFSGLRSEVERREYYFSKLGEHFNVNQRDEDADVQWATVLLAECLLLR